MRWPKNLGMTLLAVWLILYGVIPFLRISAPWFGTLMQLFAIAAGVLLWLGR